MRLWFTLRNNMVTGGLGLLLTSIVANSAWANSAQEVWYDSINGGYATLADKTQRLEVAALTYCAKPTADGRAAVIAAWTEAFYQWQAVRFVDFGPIERNNLAWQFQFWPDPKNTIARKVTFWLESEQTVSVDTLSADSIAVKGFPALEYLLFDPTVDQTHPLPQARSCQLLTGIAELVQHNSASLQDQWQSFKPIYLETPLFERTSVLAAMHSVEQLRNKRLAAPMGLQGKPRRNPYLADAWRSEHSLFGIRATLMGLQQYFLPGLRLLLTTPNGEALAERLDQQLRATITRIDKQPASMRQLLSDEDGYRSLQLVFIDVDKLNQLLGGEIANELGIVRGFNSSDGD